MTCPRCQTRNPGRAKFCLECGAALTGTLDPSTSTGQLPGESNLPEALRRLMPDEIVRKMASVSGRVQGERRVVTILFCDVKGSTAMADTLDPEDVMKIMNGAFEEMITPVIAYGGTLARLMGDAILAFFGAPTAHEDDPERACRAALDIHQGIARYAERLLRERNIRDFNIRVGIHTGLVVVGEVGNSARVEYTAMGDAVNLAARMESTAEPGTIQISENTQRLVADTIETLPLGNIAVKGKSLPVASYRVTGLRERHSTRRAENDRHGSPMVGREDESASIVEAITGLAGGRAAILALIGEAGVGKSRLISEAKKSLPGGTTWVKSWAVPYTTGTSYAMVKNLLHSATRTGPDSPAQTQGEALAKMVADFSPDRKDEVYPFLAWLMHIPLDEVTATRLKRLDAESFSGRLRESLMAFLTGMASQRPLVLCWEDLHWADPSSLKILHHLLGMVRSVPITFLLVSRPEKGDLIDMYTQASEKYGTIFRMIELDPLGRRESGRLIGNMLGERKISASTKKQILDKTEGNAFFLEEVVRSIVEGGEGAPMSFTIPETVHGVVTARLDRLPEEHRRILQTASVIGRRFRASVLESTINPVPEAGVVRELLGELTKREFIDSREHRLATPGSDPEYSFRHGITQDVVYGTMLQDQRKTLHHRVGNAIERVFSGKIDEYASTLSLHFEKARVYGKALAYSLRAAELARLSYANREAVLNYRKALKFIESDGLGAEKISGVHDSLGDVLALMGMYGDAVSHFRLALDSADTSDPISRTVIRRKIGGVFERWGKYDDADQELRTALRELGPESDPREAARVNIGLARVFFRRDEPEPASILAAETLTVMDREGDLGGAADACSILGNIAFKKGDHEAAISFYGRCLGTWEESEYMEGLAMVYNNLGQIHHQREEWDTAVVYYKNSLTISGKTGNQYGVARTCDNLSQLFAARGMQEEATGYLRQALDIFREIGKSGDAVVPEMWVQSGTL